MKLFPVLLSLSLLVALSNQAVAAKKKRKHHHRRPAPAGATSREGKVEATEEKSPEEKPSEEKSSEEKTPLDFDFFGGKSAGAGSDQAKDARRDLLAPELEREGQTRRWMLKTHQTLGIATWVLMAATVTVGQLNYNQLYGGAGGNRKWQTPHQILVLSTSAAFAATAAFAIFAPTPYKKPLHFDTGLVHRIAVIGATLGMVTEGVLGWWTTHQANAGNPNNLRTMARAHQIVGYTTFGFLTIAGTVWVF